MFAQNLPTDLKAAAPIVLFLTSTTEGPFSRNLLMPSLLGLSFQVIKVDASVYVEDTPTG
jgi:hypothetical protein